MIYTFKLYIVTLLAFLAIDMIWLVVVARSFYKKHIGYLLAPSPNWIAAFIFYLLFVAGILIFVVNPGLESGSLTKTLIKAAFFGFVTYGTYDLTNLATVREWPLIVTIVDLIWGTCLSVSVSLVAYLAGRTMA